MQLLDNAYVEDFTLRQNPTSTAVVPNSLWTKLGVAMQTATIGRWTIDGIGGLDSVARFGDILAPFRAVHELRSLAIRNCAVFSSPALRPSINDWCPGVQWA